MVKVVFFVFLIEVLVDRVNMVNCESLDKNDLIRINLCVICLGQSEPGDELFYQ